MFRRLWQKSMIGLARAPLAKRFMQEARATSFLRDQYVAGATVEAGVARAKALVAEHGVRSSLFYMGEYVDRLDLVEENTEAKLAVARALCETSLDVHVSFDPTQIGHHLDPALVPERAGRIAEVITAAETAPERINLLMSDMEDASITDASIAGHDALQEAGFSVGLTLQAYLRRTEADLARQIERGSRVRLVKGAFAADADIAFARQDEIKANSRKLIAMMLSPEAKARGFYPIIATHDTKLQDFAIAEAEKTGWPKGSYEFEMLLGVREDVAQGLARRGERVRLYVPFGREWWPHAVRRIGENPRNAVLLARSLLQ